MATPNPGLVKKGFLSALYGGGAPLAPLRASTLNLVRRPSVLSLVSLILVGGVLASATASAETYVEAMAREETSIVDYRAEIVVLQGAIAVAEDTLVDIADQIAEAETRRTVEDEKLALLPIYLELVADDLLNRFVALDQPTLVRHEMAIDAYVRNDEHMNAVLTQSTELTEEALQGIRARLLYEAIINDANDQLLAIYDELLALGVQVDSLYSRTERSQVRWGLAQSDADQAWSIIPGVDQEIATAQANIAIVEASIAAAQSEIIRLEELLVTMRWTAVLGQDIDRPALAIKIDNVFAAWPQSGINQADVVYEEVVESGLTRLIAIFQTQNPGTVGPIRSARTSDPILLEGFDRPLFAYSGANNITLDIVIASDVESVNYYNSSSAYWRSETRRAPHNLYASTSRLWNLRPERTEMPPPPFDFRGEAEALPPSAVPASEIAVDYGWTSVDYSWTGSGWARRQNGSAHVDAAGVRVAPANVIVQFVRYGTSPAAATSPEAITTGTGVAWVFTDGHMIVGEWDRTDPELPAIYHLDGETIRMSPGRTWVSLAEAGTASWN